MRRIQTQLFLCGWDSVAHSSQCNGEQHLPMQPTYCQVRCVIICALLKSPPPPPPPPPPPTPHPHHQTAVVLSPAACAKASSFFFCVVRGYSYVHVRSFLLKHIFGPYCISISSGILSPQLHNALTVVQTTALPLQRRRRGRQKVKHLFLFLPLPTFQPLTVGLPLATFSACC